MSRLDFAPPISEMKVDLEKGTMEFTARMPIDQDLLKQAVEDAGYAVEEMKVTTAGDGEEKP